mmetsp:Transcript_34065/g.73605  ORF Transcript_34065/g.73605 Transcript_34065/m.73605 type:complete len:134 (-) Transcript_34065:36-437(-)
MILENACEPVEVLGLVRAARVERESAYWAGLAQGDAGRVQVGDIEQLQQHLARVTSIKGEQDRVVVYCVASNFKPATEDSDRDDVALALENVSLFEDVVRLCCEAGVNRVILTSSMAAVRGPAQVPMNGQYVL